MADGPRARRMSGRIKQIVATFLEMNVKDPRLGMVTVTDVKVTGDLHDATIFYTVYGDEEETAASHRALLSASGMLRSEVGRITGVKFTPTLSFVADAVPENARHIEDLLRQVKEADARVQAQAVGAAYAGETDPYRVGDEADELA